MTRLHAAPMSDGPQSDPIGALEDMANRENWSYYFSPSLFASDGRSITIALLGRYGDLEFSYEWNEEARLLGVSCCIDPRIPWERRKQVRSFLDRVEKVRTSMKRSGSFDMRDDFLWFWEHLSRDESPKSPTWEILIAESLADALEHCNALMPLFLKTAWGSGDFNQKIIRLVLEEVKGTA
ncbi:hypothetical protein K8Q93_01230 [Candidatus Parcubacteria bacterium]|nr:hypothetical protein [Candidatus Parcubacteria bacterium]